MLRSIAIVFLLIFALYLFDQGFYVERTMTYVEERAKFTQKHGLRGLLNDIWCGNPTCSK